MGSSAGRLTVPSPSRVCSSTKPPSLLWPPCCQPFWPSPCPPTTQWSTPCLTHASEWPCKRTSPAAACSSPKPPPTQTTSPPPPPRPRSSKQSHRPALLQNGFQRQ